MFPNLFNCTNIIHRFVVYSKTFSQSRTIYYFFKQIYNFIFVSFPRVLEAYINIYWNTCIYTQTSEIFSMIKNFLFHCARYELKIFLHFGIHFFITLPILKNQLRLILVAQQLFEIFLLQLYLVSFELNVFQVSTDLNIRSNWSYFNDNGMFVSFQSI